MKPILTLFVVTLFANTAFSQQDPKYVYCEIMGIEKLLSTQVTIVVDFGQRIRTLTDNRLKDDDGEAIVFNTMIEALNFMARQGWELQQAYTAPTGGQNICHYLLKKPYAELDEEAKRDFNRKSGRLLSDLD